MWIIDDESVHNWRNYVGRRQYFSDLPAEARRAMEAAHDRHHQTTTAREELLRLVAEWPAVFELPTCIARRLECPNA